MQFKKDIEMTKFVEKIDMFKSKIYSNYFPIMRKYTQFDENEKKKLCKWASVFRDEVLTREIEKSRKGYGYYSTYDIIHSSIYNGKDKLQRR